MLTIAGLGLTSLVTAGRTDLELVETFRTIIVYGFAFGLIAAIPCTMVATRQLSDALWKRKPDQAPIHLLGSLIASAGLSAFVFVLLYFVLFPLPADLALAGVVSGILIALLWTAATFSSATHDYMAVALAFLVGTLCSLVGAVFMAFKYETASDTVWGYAFGLALSLTLLLVRIAATFPFETDRKSRPLASLVSGFRLFPLLALGGLLNALGIWVDKWIVWSSPYGERTAAGLPHSAIYDNAIFLAYLMIVPPLAIFVVHLETRFSRNFGRFTAIILQHGTLEDIEQAGIKTKRDTLGTLRKIILFQTAMCCALIILVPQFAELLGLQQRQVPIIQIGLLGTIFHFILIASGSILLYLDLQQRYVGIQLLYLMTLGGFTTLSLLGDGQYLGMGYLVATVVSGSVAYLMLLDALDRIDYHFFMSAIFRNGKT